jgi:hypothetical protein
MEDAAIGRALANEPPLVLAGVAATAVWRAFTRRPRSKGVEVLGALRVSVVESAAFEDR